MEYTHIVHPFGPLYDENSEILILGSLPSVKSREQNFFYGHPQNRYWPLIAALFEEPAPENIEEKKALVLKHHIAMWDTIYSCDIMGSSDSSIKNVMPTDLKTIVDYSKVTRVFCNGATSGKYYHKYQEKILGIPATVLPSTSPANAAWQMPRLLEAWKVILPSLQDPCRDDSASVPDSYGNDSASVPDSCGDDSASVPEAAVNFIKNDSRI